MSKILTDSLKIHINENFKELDHHKLLQAYIFFASDVFEKYINIFNNATLVISNEEDIDGCQGRFLINNQDLCFLVNPIEILRAIQVKYSFKNYKRSIIFTILHEIGHGVDFLELISQQQNYKEKSLEKWFDELNEKMGNQKDLNENLHLSDAEISRKIPHEIYADRFAFKNLSYFINLYKFEGVLI